MKIWVDLYMFLLHQQKLPEEYIASITKALNNERSAYTHLKTPWQAFDSFKAWATKPILHRWIVVYDHTLCHASECLLSKSFQPFLCFDIVSTIISFSQHNLKSSRSTNPSLTAQLLRIETRCLNLLSCSQLVLSFFFTRITNIIIITTMNYFQYLALNVHDALFHFDEHHELSCNKTGCCWYFFLSSFFSFSTNMDSEKEDITEPYGECGQRSIIESDYPTITIEFDS